MKAEAQKEAKRLRKEEGESVKVIAQKLGVSKNSASRWVKDIDLTETQKVQLTERNPAINGYSVAAKARQQKAREQRQQWQDEGREMARTLGTDFIAGCMLYWAEGDKSKNVYGMTNSDASMIELHMNWLRRFFGFNETRIMLKINVYTGEGLTLENIENYWLKTIGINKHILSKFTINCKSNLNGGKNKGKLPYGICTVRYCDTPTVQRIFGAIKEYVGIDSDKWLN